MAKNKNLIYIAISLVVFIVLAFLYSTPVFTGKQLFQHDIVQYRGGAKELLDYRASNEKETYWSDSMFGGMPTYQMGSQFKGDIIKQIDSKLNFLPRPVNYLFLLFGGFFLLGMVAVRNWKYALLGATFFGLSTYFYIAIAAGHNGKVNTIEYFAPLLAGILLVYIRKSYIWGFIVTTLFMGLQIAANHPQMTYYLFLALGFLFLSELIRAIQKKIPMKHFLVSSGIIAASCFIGVGMNSQRIMANSEYIKETVRGKQILTNESNTGGDSGMDKESMLMWSYGKLETLNLFIPRLMGGGSQEPEGKEMMAKVQELVQENVGSRIEYDRISKGFGNLTYWGDQPGTSGPAYQGAIVCFLAVLGFFFAWKKYRYWILGASILTVFLAWGSNFMAFSDFFIDFVPFYNKFRAPSSILVVVELLFPLIAILGLYRFFTDSTLTEEYKKKILLYVGGGNFRFHFTSTYFRKSFIRFPYRQRKNISSSFPIGLFG
ncbi:multisubunit Na+/H+ antiporter MnhG subunit [Chryseobacterium ginsenosidimutans]|nr:multisubunit Na+/H+ antiporter MnhG subunit [Chryseobacterium ginsenosidimutans]